MTESELEELMAEEEARWQRIRQMAAANADDLARLWHMGDGCGGSVSDAIATELQKAGYDCQSLRQFYESRPDSPNHRRHHKVGSKLKKQVFERDRYRCLTCGGYKDLSIDHIYPISKGGATELANLQTLCRSCNSNKGTRTKAATA